MTETQTVKPHKADHQSFALSAQEPGPKEACPPHIILSITKKTREAGQWKNSTPLPSSHPRKVAVKKAYGSKDRAAPPRKRSSKNKQFLQQINEQIDPIKTTAQSEHCGKSRYVLETTDCLN